jgi:hypothetical protein
MGQGNRSDRIAGHRCRGALSRPCGLSRALSTFAARRMATDLVQAGGLVRRSMPNPRWALRLASGGGTRMPRTPLLQPTSRATCTRRDFTFGDRPPSAVGKPAGVRLSDRPWTGNCRVWSDAGPPCGHPASDSHALDGAPLASGRPSWPPLWTGTLTRTRGCLCRRGGRAPWPFQPSVAPSGRAL